MAKILPTDGFVRSPEIPGAIVNVDNSALEAYKLRRQKEKTKLDEINSLKQEVADIKSLLTQLIEKLK